MGCWNEACDLSHLQICYGDLLLILLKEKIIVGIKYILKKKLFFGGRLNIGPLSKLLKGSILF